MSSRLSTYNQFSTDSLSSVAATIGSHVKSTSTNVLLLNPQRNRNNTNFIAAPVQDNLPAQAIPGDRTLQVSVYKLPEGKCTRYSKHAIPNIDSPIDQQNTLTEHQKSQHGTLTTVVKKTHTTKTHTSSPQDVQMLPDIHTQGSCVLINSERKTPPDQCGYGNGNGVSYSNTLPPFAASDHSSGCSQYPRLNKRYSNHPTAGIKYRPPYRSSVHSMAAMRQASLYNHDSQADKQSHQSHRQGQDYPHVQRGADKPGDVIIIDGDGQTDERGPSRSDQKTTNGTKRIVLHVRPPLTRRHSAQYSKVADRNLLVQSRLIPLSRRASYSGVTGISPMSVGPADIGPVLSELRNEDGQVCSGLDTSEVKMHCCSPKSASEFGKDFLSLILSEKKKVDDFNFINTLETATRPYTPDMFAMQAGMLNTGNKTKVKSNRRSVGSLVTLRNRPTLKTTPKLPRNVLRKKTTIHKSSLSNLKNSRTREVPTYQTIITTDLFRRSRISSRTDRSLEIPHTATTCAGPSKGIIKEVNMKSTYTGSSIDDPSIHASSVSSLDGLCMSLDFNDGITKTWARLGIIDKWGKESKVCGLINNSSFPNANSVRLKGSKKTTECSSMSKDVTSSGNTFFADSPFYLPTAFQEREKILRKVWINGWDFSFEGFRHRRRLERTYKYGPAGRKIPRYMRGALPGSPMKPDTSFSPWMRSHIKWNNRGTVFTRIRDQLRKHNAGTAQNEDRHIFSTEKPCLSNSYLSQGVQASFLKSRRNGNLDRRLMAGGSDRISGFIEQLDILRDRRETSNTRETPKGRDGLHKRLCENTGIFLKNALTSCIH
ncbi:hypothetical protein EDC01DRAFT_673466 [Geopyxis carbonaria]|nr:hypothetical protein EDC01DRAFT_673466 [Geopyxis carbonaria]